MSYLESDFPLFVAMKGKEHAIVVAGYSWREASNAASNGNTHVWSQVDSLLAVDDNLLPYSTVSVDVSSTSGGDATAYTVDDFSAFIVPLPEKIFYSASDVEFFFAWFLVPNVQGGVWLAGEGRIAAALLYHHSVGIEVLCAGKQIANGR